MSPRAAWRLERLGFQEVYDYVLGKADWLAAGLPTEGSGPGKPRAVDVVDRSVPTCGPGEALKLVTDRVRAAGWDSCVVVNERQIVLGRLRLDRIEQTAQTVVEDVMEPGPATVRADADVGQTVERLRDRRIPDIIVTTPDGELVGVLHANDE
jgi:CBS domain-containing protein